MTSPQAGWYPAPSGAPGVEQYWDGSDWTGRTRTLPQGVRGGRPRKRKRRVFSWIIVGVNVLFLIWLIVGLSDAANQTAKQCAHQQLSQQLCHDASNAGTAIGAGIVIFLWVAVDIILGVIWLVTRKREPQIVYVQGGPPPQV